MKNPSNENDPVPPVYRKHLQLRKTFNTTHSEIITKASWLLFRGTMKLTVYFAIFTTSLQGLFVAAAELDLADEQARSKTLEGGGRNVLGLSVSQRRELHHHWSWPFDEVQP